MEYIWLLILSALGFLISYYIQNKVHRKKQKLVCLKVDSCNAVVTSKFGNFFGVDNTILGMLYFLIIFIIGFLQFLFPAFFALDTIFLGKLVFSGVTALFSVYLIFIQLFILKKLCEYCLATSAISISIFLVILL